MFDVVVLTLTADSASTLRPRAAQMHYATRRGTGSSLVEPPWSKVALWGLRAIVFPSQVNSTPHSAGKLMHGGGRRSALERRFQERRMR